MPPALWRNVWPSWGYVGFALDAYGKGIRGSLAGDNSALMNPLMADRALLRSRLLAGFETAKQHQAVDGTRIAAIGYCFGGLCVLDLARAVPQNLKGVVSFHGNYKPPEIGKQPRISAKILILHGWEDPINPPPDVLAIARELTNAEADWQLHAYGHAQHSFTFIGANFPERGIVYNAAADRRSWASMRAFLEEILA
jgi:dienelactone hydrolase